MPSSPPWALSSWRLLSLQEVLISWWLLDYTLESGAFGSRAILWEAGRASFLQAFAAAVVDEKGGVWAFCADLCELGRLLSASVSLYRCFEWRLDELRHQHGLLVESWWQRYDDCLEASDSSDSDGCGHRFWRRMPSGFCSLERYRENANSGCPSPSSSHGS